jgi:pyruvate,water dikinase
MTAFVLPIDSPDASPLVAGAKAVSLRELARWGFPVPPGFVVTTAAQRKAATMGAMPPEIAQEIRAALRALGAEAVAVRSSATAEDLEDASFAGQHDTFLGVRGEGTVLAAIERCWASLWSERAVAYRAANGILDDDLATGVIVQVMIDAQTAGVVFTANPLTGRRDEIVIDAVRGLGEALVSGRIEPERYVLDAATLALKQVRTVAEPVLDTATMGEVARTARAIAEHAGSPRDIEWAYSASGLAILQSRPITTLYPLLPMPSSARGLRVCINTLLGQGVEVPLTPLGLDVHFLLQKAYLRLLSVKRSPEEVTLHAGLREFQDVTELIADRRLRAFALTAIGAHDTWSRRAIESLIEQRRIRERPVFTTNRKLLFLRSSSPVLVRLVAGLIAPKTVRRHALRVAEERLAQADARGRQARSLDAALAGVVSDIGHVVDDYWVGVGSLTFSAFVCQALLNRWLPRWATLDPELVLKLLRGVPANVTTEMNLSLWAIATELRGDPAARAALRHEHLDETASDYLAGRAPAALQARLARFLDSWGGRGDVEIDIGRPRWRDDPVPILGTLSAYLDLNDSELAPDALHRRGGEEAHALEREIVATVRQRAAGCGRGLCTRRSTACEHSTARASFPSTPMSECWPRTGRDWSRLAPSWRSAESWRCQMTSSSWNSTRCAATRRASPLI